MKEKHMDKQMFVLISCLQRINARNIRLNEIIMRVIETTTTQLQTTILLERRNSTGKLCTKKKKMKSE